MEEHVMRGQPREYEAINAIATSGADGPVVMLNLNRYTEFAEFPDGAEYRAYMAVLVSTVEQVGGKVLWRTNVLGQPIGCEHDRVDEILAVWYPTHQAFIALREADGADEMFRRRERCVANAVLHRCPADRAPMTP